MIDVSVLVLTYKFDYEKLFRTLYSIIIQKNIKFQIIISDDGTPDFNILKIEKWFSRFNFCCYQIVTSGVNVGTVKNVNKGLKYCTGKYLKMLSPGDFLYDEMTLKSFYDFCEKFNYKICFGNAIYYRIYKNEIEIFPKLRSPRILSPYKKKDYKKCAFYYLILGDFMISPSYFIDLQFFKYYFSKVVDKVKYVEDSACFLMVAEGICINYNDCPIIWYEHGSGISTSGDKKWNNLIKNDICAVGGLIEEINPKYSLFNQMHNHSKGLKVIVLKIYRKIFFKLSKCFTNVRFDIKKLNYILKERVNDKEAL